MKLIIISLLLVSTMLGDCTDDTPYSFATSSTSTYSIPLGELQLIYAGKITRWRDSSRIIVYVRPFNDYTQSTMVTELLGVSNSTFIERVNKNSNVHVTDNTSILFKLMSTPGSMAMVDSETILFKDTYGVHQLKVKEY